MMQKPSSSGGMPMYKQTTDEILSEILSGETPISDLHDAGLIDLVDVLTFRLGSPT